MEVCVASPCSTQFAPDQTQSVRFGSDSVCSIRTATQESSRYLSGNGIFDPAQGQMQTEWPWSLFKTTRVSIASAISLCKAFNTGRSPDSPAKITRALPMPEKAPIASRSKCSSQCPQAIPSTAALISSNRFSSTSPRNRSVRWMFYALTQHTPSTRVDNSRETASSISTVCCERAIAMEQLTGAH